MNKPTPMVHGTLIFFSSPDGDLMPGKTWTPVLPKDVPEFCKDPDVLARLVDGEACADTTDGAATIWYRAERVMTDADREKIGTILDMRKRRLVAAVASTLH